MRFFADRKAQRPLRHAAVMVIDLTIAAIAFAAAYVTIYGYPEVLQLSALDAKSTGFVFSSLAAFLMVGTYRGAWRYASVPDLTVMIKGAVGALIIYTVGAFLLTRGQNVPRSVLMLALIYMVVGLIGTRLVYRMVVERLMQFPGLLSTGPEEVRHVLLCGLTDKAESFIRAGRRGSRYQVVGILDSSQVNEGRRVQGIRVYGPLERLDRVVAKLKSSGIVVKELVVTETAPGRRRINDIVEQANKCSITVSRIPELTDTALITSGNLLEPRPIEICDLLERPEVSADIEDISRFIRDKVVLATGAGGSIGSELCRQVADLRPKRLVITDGSEFLLYTLDTELRDRHPELEVIPRIVDVRDSRRVERVFDEFRPDVVLHAAALKHLPQVEDNPLEAVKTNVLGTRNVANAALSSEVSTMMMISTDKAVNPTSIMGATKRAAEAYCQSLDVTSAKTRFKTVRFGNVLGSAGSVVPRFREQIAAGGPITVTHPDIVRYFMTIPEAVNLVLHASAHAIEHQTERGEIMVLDMGKPVRILDLAERMILLAGYKPRVDIDIVFTGLRPGEKLSEELFDPSEIQDGASDKGYFVAAPRVIDRQFLRRTLAELEACLEREDIVRATELLSHLVPEYRKTVVEETPPENQAVETPPDGKAVVDVKDQVI